MTNLTKYLRTASASKSGVALVMVLGFLSVLIILGLSFSNIMRTERLAARNYGDGTAAKNLAYVGLTRAIEDLDTILLQADPPAIYPPSDYYDSDYLDLGDGEAITNLIDGVASDHIPEVLLAGAENEVQGLRWQTVFNEFNDEPVGRYAYLAVNCSGFLDVNYGSEENTSQRYTGTNAVELYWGDLSEFQSGSPTFDEFNDYRTETMKRYESYKEYKIRSPVDLVNQQNFFVHSKSFPSFWWDADEIKPKIDVSLPANYNDQNIMRQAFSDCGLNPPEVNLTDLYANWIDFVDSDSVPQNLNSFCTEPVPMINEIIVSNWVQQTGPGVFDHHIVYEVETWYPFPATATAPPQGYTVGVGGAPSFWQELAQQIAPAPPVNASNLAPPPPTLPPGSFPNVSSTFDADSRFQTHRIVYTHTHNFPGATAVRFGARVSIPSFTVTIGSDTVDLTPQLVNGTPLNLNMINYTVGNAGSGLGPASFAYSAKDPRYNWLSTIAENPGQIADPGRHWVRVAATPGQMNASAVLQVGEGPGTMFVRNAAPETVWEIGFLTTGRPWESIRLVDVEDLATGDEMELHRVVDVFTVGPEVPHKGLVNLNTRRREVLATAFNQTQIQTYPGQTIIPSGSGATPNIGWTRATDMADAILALGSPPRNNNNNLLYAISAIGDLSVVEDWPNTWSIPERESIIGNSYQMLTMRDNVFTIVVAAQPGRDVNDNGVIDGNEVIAERRAVAIVARDPYPSNASGFWEGTFPTGMRHQRPYIRYLRWLYE